MYILIGGGRSMPVIIPLSPTLVEYALWHVLDMLVSIFYAVGENNALTSACCHAVDHLKRS